MLPVFRNSVTFVGSSTRVVICPSVKCNFEDEDEYAVLVE
jgi:hypothetical protein